MVISGPFVVRLTCVMYIRVKVTTEYLPSIPGHPFIDQSEGKDEKLCVCVGGGERLHTTAQADIGTQARISALRNHLPLEHGDMELIGKIQWIKRKNEKKMGDMISDMMKLEWEHVSRGIFFFFNEKKRKRKIEM